MKFNKGDILTLKLYSKELQKYLTYVVIKEYNGTILTHLEDKTNTIMLDKEQVLKRMGISWSHQPASIFNEELFTL